MGGPIFRLIGQKPDAHFGPRVPDSSPIRLRFGTPGRTFRPIPLFIRAGTRFLPVAREYSNTRLPA